MKKIILKPAQYICKKYPLGLFKEGGDGFFPVEPISDLTQGRVVPWLGDLWVEHVVRGGALKLYVAECDEKQKLIIEYGVLKQWGAYYHSAPKYKGYVCVLDLDEPRAKSIIKKYVDRIEGLEKRGIPQHAYTPDYLITRIKELGEINKINPFQGGMVTEEITRRDAVYYYPWLSLIDALEMRPE